VHIFHTLPNHHRIQNEYRFFLASCIYPALVNFLNASDRIKREVYFDFRKMFKYYCWNNSSFQFGTFFWLMKDALSSVVYSDKGRLKAVTLRGPFLQSSRSLLWFFWKNLRIFLSSNFPNISIFKGFPIFSTLQVVVISHIHQYESQKEEVIRKEPKVSLVSLRCRIILQLLTFSTFLLLT
jgi:hypothetical protein